MCENSKEKWRQTVTLKLKLANDNVLPELCPEINYVLDKEHSIPVTLFVKPGKRERHVVYLT